MAKNGSGGVLISNARRIQDGISMRPTGAGGELIFHKDGTIYLPSRFGLRRKAVRRWVDLTDRATLSVFDTQ